MKSVAIVAAHFVPSNLAAVHRARLWSLHLREFGWEPIIVTTHWDYYEEEPEFDLCELLPGGLQIIRTRALPTKPLRVIGDIGARAFPWHLAALKRLCRMHTIDFIHITIPSFYSACLGRMVSGRSGVPYGIDYIDPWVYDAHGTDVPFTKPWITQRLATMLEPWAVRRASLITGINPAYYEGMLQRNPYVRDTAVCASMPYGGSELDHQFVRQHPRPATLFASHPGKFNLIYAGAMLPHAYPVVEKFFEALVLINRNRPSLGRDFHVHFVGTRRSPADSSAHGIQRFAEGFGLNDCVSEHPRRMPYLDVLNHLEAASGVLVIGSTEPHYSPSKIFQALMSRKPVFAMLHESSTAVGILEAARAGTTLTFTSTTVPEPNVIAAALERFIYANDYSVSEVDWSCVNEHSARSSARRLAEALDAAVAQNRGASVR